MQIQFQHWDPSSSGLDFGQVEIYYKNYDARTIDALRKCLYSAAKQAGYWHRSVAQRNVTTKKTAKNIIDFLLQCPAGHPYWRKVAPIYFTPLEIEILQRGDKRQIRATVRNANWRLQNARSAQKFSKTGKRVAGEMLLSAPAPAGKGFQYNTGALHDAIVFDVYEEAGTTWFAFGVNRRTRYKHGVATDSVFLKHELGKSGYPERPVLKPALHAGIHKGITQKILAKVYKQTFKRELQGE